MNKKKSFIDILFLCLRSRCPVCGQGDLFTRLTLVKTIAHLCIPPERCNHCDFQFAREPGYYFGILTPLLPILSLGTGLIFVIIYYFVLHPEEPSELFLPGAVGTAIGFILFFRSAIAIFISLD